MKNKFISSIILVLMFFVFILPSINAAKLGNYEVSIYLDSPNSTHIVENWYIEYNYLNLRDLDNFKTSIMEASLDPTELVAIDPNLKPHIYISQPPVFSIKFDDIKNLVTLDYTINDLVLINYFENKDEILWQFNSNLLSQFVINDLYSIPKESSITIWFYDPLTIDDPAPGIVESNKLYLSGFTSNQIKILALEMKPPEPSFIFGNMFKDMGQKGLYNYLIIIIILIIIMFIFRKKLRSKFKKFVISKSVIEPKKVKKDFFEDEIIEE